MGQLRAGADLVKLYVQAPGGGSPWTSAEIARVVKVVHAAGARVAAHVRDLDGARAAVGGGVDAIDHGFQIDAALARTMAAQGTYLVTTITVPKTWLAFAKTAPGSWFASADGRATSHKLLREALASARIAHRAGVKIAAGTDFGGGGAHAGVLAGEVQSLVEAGLQPWEALAARPARGGGAGRRLGSSGGGPPLLLVRARGVGVLWGSGEAAKGPGPARRGRVPPVALSVSPPVE